MLKAREMALSELKTMTLRKLGKCLGEQISRDGNMLKKKELIALTMSHEEQAVRDALSDVRGGHLKTYEDAFDYWAERFGDEEVALALGRKPLDFGDTASGAVAPSYRMSDVDKTDLTHEKNAASEMVNDLSAILTSIVDKKIKEHPGKVSITKIHVKNDVNGTARELDGVTHEAFEEVIELASQRVNIYLVGPAGCGKTMLASQVADALELQFASVSCSAGMSESQLAGWLLPTGEGGRFEYRHSPFIDIYENGGVFLFDEIDSADPNTMTFINAAIANGHMHVPQRLGNPVVQRHADCVIMAAANTFGLGGDLQYIGRNRLDAATLDRFRAGFVDMDYSDLIEKSVADRDVLEWGKEMRSKIKEHGLERILSTRTLVNFTKMKRAYNWGRSKWEEKFCKDWTKDEKSRIGVRF